MKNRQRTLRDSVGIAPDAMSAAADPFGTESSSNKRAVDMARSGVLVRVTPELRRALKLAAIERSTSVQSLMLQAVEIVLGRHDDSPPPKGPAGP
jgi:hypothetical protein